MARVTDVAASARWRSGDAWHRLGYFFSVFALIAVHVIPSPNHEPLGTRKAPGDDAPFRQLPEVAAQTRISVSDELEKLAAFRNKGVLTEEGFHSQEQSLEAKSSSRTRRGAERG